MLPFNEFRLEASISPSISSHQDDLVVPLDWAIFFCMPARNGTAHVVTTTRKCKDQAYRTHLLRRSCREDGMVRNETLGNLSHLPESLTEIIRRSLPGQTFVPLAQAFEITRSRAHGHVQAVALAMQRLGWLR